MSEENTTPNMQRPIGIKPITIKPMQAPAKAPEAPDANTDTSAASEPSLAAIKPMTILPASAQGKPLDTVAATTTIRLKPVVQTSGVVSPSAAIAPQPLRPATLQPPSIKPSVHPSLDSASKSKTSRISLDSAFGETTVSPLINIRPSSTAPIGKITSNLSTDSLTIAKGQTAKVSLPLQTSESEVTRRRTLRVKAPTQVAEEKPEPSENLTEAPTIRKKKTLVLKKNQANSDSGDADEAGGDEEHVSAFSAFQNQPVEKTSPIFPVLAVAALFMIVALTVMYMSQACGPDRSLTAFSSYSGMSAPSWPGKINSF